MVKLEEIFKVWRFSNCKLHIQFVNHENLKGSGGASVMGTVLVYEMRDHGFDVLINGLVILVHNVQLLCFTKDKGG